MDALPPEPVGVNPRIDCVFKALLGDPNRRGILLEFLNAILGRAVPIVDVVILNPVHLPDYIGDHFTSIDVKATDAAGNVYQVEMQSWNEAALKARILYTWADLYEKQLKGGDAYDQLKPVIAIWMLDENIHRGATQFHHRFVVCDPSDGMSLIDHLEIHTLELERWRRRPGEAPAEVTRWMTFFAEAETWAEVPEALRTAGMEEAMAVLKEFRTNAELNEVYRARLDGMRRQKAQDNALARAIAEREQERAAKEVALAEAARLRRLLEQLGRSSDELT